MGWLGKLLGGGKGDEALPLYEAVVARARMPHWYVEGAVPDTVDGRFDMIAAVLSIALIRLEEEPAGAVPAAQLAERFVDDMDAQLRQIGVGDVVVGKQVGRMMAALGGRLGAYRDGAGGRRAGGGAGPQPLSRRGAGAGGAEPWSRPSCARCARRWRRCRSRGWSMERCHEPRMEPARAARCDRHRRPHRRDRRRTRRARGAGAAV